MIDVRTFGVPFFGRFGTMGAFMPKRTAALIAGIAAFSLALPATAQTPSMSSAWLAIKVSQDECVRIGTEAMKRSGLTRGFEVLSNASIYGEIDSYTGLVRCVAEKDIAYFVVAGPEAKECSRHMNAVRDFFRNRL